MLVHLMLMLLSLSWMMSNLTSLIYQERIIYLGSLMLRSISFAMNNGDINKDGNDASQ